MENKKTLLLTILGVLVLVIAVIGVSFAMYSFVGTGTKVNVITTGTVNVAYTESTVIALDNQYPMSDALGSAQTGVNNTMQFTVAASMTGAMNIKYDLAMDQIVPGSTLTAQYIKFNITKNGTYILGTSATTGITVASRSANAGTLITSGYLLDTDTFTVTTTNTYVIKAWVSDQYVLPTTDTSSGDTHSNTTTSETFKFKISVVATQI